MPVYEGGDFFWWEVSRWCPLVKDNVLFPSKVDGSVSGEPDDRGARVYGSIGNLPGWKVRMPYRGLPVHRVAEPRRVGMSFVVPYEADG